MFDKQDKKFILSRLNIINETMNSVRGNWGGGVYERFHLVKFLARTLLFEMDCGLNVNSCSKTWEICDDLIHSDITESDLNLDGRYWRGGISDKIKELKKHWKELEPF